MTDRQEKKEKVKVYDEIGVLLQLEIGGKRYLFEKHVLPLSLQRTAVGKTCKVTLVWEGSKLIGVKDGGRVVRVKSY